MKPLYFVGVLALLAGIIGIVLPVLPTTPFVLLAGFCFAQTSEKSHAWLMRNKLFGPVLLNWECKRCVALRSKCLSLSMMTIGGVISVGFLLDSVHARWVTALLMLIGAVVVVRLKTCPSINLFEAGREGRDFSSVEIAQTSSSISERSL